MRTNSEKLESDAGIIEVYLNDWVARKPALASTHMMIFFREHVQILRDVAEAIQ